MNLTPLTLSISLWGLSNLERVSFLSNVTAVSLPPQNGISDVSLQRMKLAIFFKKT